MVCRERLDLGPCRRDAGGPLQPPVVRKGRPDAGRVDPPPTRGPANAGDPAPRVGANLASASRARPGPSRANARSGYAGNAAADRVRNDPVARKGNDAAQRGHQRLEGPSPSAEPRDRPGHRRRGAAPARRRSGHRSGTGPAGDYQPPSRRNRSTPVGLGEPGRRRPRAIGPAHARRGGASESRRKGEEEKGRKGEGEKWRGEAKRHHPCPLLPFSPSPFLPFSLSSLDHADKFKARFQG